MRNLLLLLTVILISLISTAQPNVFSTNAPVGIGTTTPQKKLDVRTGSNKFVSIGGTINNGQYSGLHFGYSAYNNSDYKKSAIVFERVDNAARGRIHFLNIDGNNFDE